MSANQVYRITNTFCTPQLKIDLEIGGKLREVEGDRGERKRGRRKGKDNERKLVCERYMERERENERMRE